MNFIFLFLTIVWKLNEHNIWIQPDIIASDKEKKVTGGKIKKKRGT